MKIDFEKDQDFTYGKGNTWEYASKAYYANVLIEKQRGIVHSGLQSLMLSTPTPNNDLNRRNEILIEIDPLTTKKIEFSSWINIPKQPINSYISLFRALYERVWINGETPYYWYNGLTFSIYYPDLRIGRPTYNTPIFEIVMNKGDVDTTSFGQPTPLIFYPVDMQTKYENGKFVWNESDSTKRYTVNNYFDKWFRLRTVITRDLNDYNNGRIAWYLTPPNSDNETLLYSPNSNAEKGWNPDTPIRTVGITPELIASEKSKNWENAHYCIGLSVYTSIGANPCKTFFDDVELRINDGLKILKGTIIFNGNFYMKLEE